MNNLREIKDDILKDWIEFREETISSMIEEDKKHFIYYEEISKRILNSIPNKNMKYVQKQLEILDRNIFDYTSLGNEKYYRNGFCDGVQIFLINSHFTIVL